MKTRTTYIKKLNELAAARRETEDCDEYNSATRALAHLLDAILPSADLRDWGVYIRAGSRHGWIEDWTLATHRAGLC